MPSNLLTAQEHCSKVDIERVLPPVKRVTFSTTDGGHTSVIDQNINGTQGLLHLLQRCVDLHLLLEVSRHCQGTYAKGFELCDHGLQTLQPSSHHSHIS